MILNVNTEATVAFTNKLEKINKSAFPVAARGTLNDAAFDVKVNTMPESSRSTFEKRSPNFFKANSRFDKADGFNINTMESNVGFYQNKLKNSSTNYAVKDLEQQETGGTIHKKAFIPQTSARKGGKGVVRPNARLSAINKIANRRNAKGVNWAQQMIKSALHVGEGGFVLTEQLSKARGGALFRIKSINRKNGRTSFKAEKLYSFKKGREVVVKATSFMKEASLATSEKMEKFYINQALRQFRKAGIIK